MGRDSGYRRVASVDNFIHSVVRTQEEMQSLWVDNRLTTACQNGYTLIYDEFNRSRPEANNALLSILSERILNLPLLRGIGKGTWRSTRTSGRSSPPTRRSTPGTHKTQDALLDRLVTIHLGPMDRETEVQITMAKSGIARRDAEAIVDIVRELRGVGVNNHRPTIRACITIARVMAGAGARRAGRPGPPVGLPRRAHLRHGQGDARRRVAHAAEGRRGDPEGMRTGRERHDHARLQPILRGAQDCRTLSTAANQTFLPHRTYLRVACLEMEKFRRTAGTHAVPCAGSRTSTAASARSTSSGTGPFPRWESALPSGCRPGQAGGPARPRAGAGGFRFRY